MKSERSADALPTQDLSSLLQSMIEQVLRTESPCTLMGPRNADGWVPKAVVLPQANVVELSGGANFVDDLERYLGEREELDSLLLLPPLIPWRSLPPRFRRIHRGQSLQDVALKQTLNLAPVGTRMAALLPVHFFSSERLRSLREVLQCHLRVVIEHNHSWPSVHPSFRMHTAVFEKTRGDAKSGSALLRFFRIPSEVNDDHGLTLEVENDLRRLLARTGGPTNWGFVLRDGLPDGEPWVFDLYSPQSVALQNDLRELGELRPLADLADFAPIINVTARRASLLDAEHEEGIPLLEGRNITRAGVVLWDQARYRIREPSSLLQPGDICLRAIWSPSTRLVVASIPNGSPRLAPAHSLIVLRKRPGTTPEQWQVLTEYLRSDRASDLMAGRALGSIHLSRQALAKLSVPVPDEALSVALRSLTAAAADFESWRKDTERQKRALFSFAATREGRLNLLQSGKRARQRQRAARSVDELPFRIRTQFPYPIAYRWRTVEARADGLEDYHNVLDCAEATLCYLALMAIIGAQSVGLHIGKLEDVGRQLVERGKGIGLGDWIGVLREVGASKSFRRVKAFPFPEVLTVLKDKDPHDAVQRLFEARNDQAHQRGPREGELPEALEERCADLEVLLSAVEFLAEYRLRAIEETRRDSLSGLTLIRCRDLMGDHPLVPLAEDQQESAEIEKDSLYFLDRTGRYYLARPWLTWQQCPKCRRPAAFHPERYDRSQGRVSLKSLEHGHVMDDNSLLSVFRTLKFLK